MNIDIVLFSSKLITASCLEVIGKSCRVLAIVEDGPDLKRLPFLASPREYFKEKGIPHFNHEDLVGGKCSTYLDQAKLAVSIGYGSILKSEIFKNPCLGTVNLHPGKLPKGRGSHPDLFAVINGEPVLGMTLHEIDEGVDSGNVIYQDEIPVEGHDDMVSLTEKLYNQGSCQLEQLFAYILEHDRLPPSTPQPLPPSSLDMRIDWEDSAKRIYNTIRALTYPWPMAHTYFNGKKMELCSARIVKQEGLTNPGQVIHITPEGVIVGAGRDSILIKKVRDVSGAWLEGEQIAKTLKIVEGDSLTDLLECTVTAEKMT